MKSFKLFITCCIMFVCTGIKAQFVGQFSRLQDGHIYFQILNQTGSVQRLGWFVVNEQTCEYKNNIQPIGPFQIQIFGPGNIGWKWQRGEKFVVWLSNGEKAEWVCPYSDGGEISFRQGVHGSCNISSHGCPGYVDNDNNNLCDNCPKSERCHITRHQRQ